MSMLIESFQSTFDGCAPYWQNPIVSPIINAIDNNTTLQKIELHINENFPNKSFSEASHTFKFYVFQRAITMENRGLIHELILKEGKKLLEYHDSSIFSSVHQVRSAEGRFTMLKTLIDLEVNLNEKLFDTISVVEMFYQNYQSESIFLFNNRKIEFPSPLNKSLEESLELIKKANNFVHFIFGKQDSKSSINFLNKDCFIKICNYVAKTTIFKKIEK